MKAKALKLALHCRIFGVGATGPLAGVFPDVVAFTFEVFGRGVEVSGFVACHVATRDTEPKDATVWIPTALVKAARKAITEEYGRRWRKIVVIETTIAPVKPRKVKR